MNQAIWAGLLASFIAGGIGTAAGAGGAGLTDTRGVGRGGTGMGEARARARRSRRQRTPVAPAGRAGDGPGGAFPAIALKTPDDHFGDAAADGFGIYIVWQPGIQASFHIAGGKAFQERYVRLPSALKFFFGQFGNGFILWPEPEFVIKPECGAF